MKNIESLENQGADRENDYYIKRNETPDGSFILEEHINKNSGELKEFLVIDRETGELERFDDIEALENSEYLHDWIKAHYINRKINLSDEKIRQMARKYIFDISGAIMDSEKSRAAN